MLPGKKKRILVFGIQYGFPGLEGALAALEPHMEKGKKLGLELPQTIVDFLKRLYEKNIFSKKEVGKEYFKFTLSYIKEIFGPNYSKERIEKMTGSGFSTFLTYYRIYTEARKRGMEIIPLENPGIHKRLQKLDPEFRQLIKLVMQKKVSLEVIARNKLFKKHCELGWPVRESWMVKNAVGSNVDLMVVGAAHLEGIVPTKVKEFKFVKAFEARLTGEEARLHKENLQWARMARKLYKEHCKLIISSKRVRLRERKRAKLEKSRPKRKQQPK